MSILLNLDFICIKIPGSLKQERFKYMYTNIRHHIFHGIQEKSTRRELHNTAQNTALTDIQTDRQTDRQT